MYALNDVLSAVYIADSANPHPYEDAEEREGQAAVGTVDSAGAELTLEVGFPPLVGRVDKGHKPHETPQPAGHCIHNHYHLLHLYEHMHTHMHKIIINQRKIAVDTIM